ncbi:unnamed protein product [Amoebophrya sp. A120]|nr:unnamed protein product [Amoebophrya sp. A120]|eukprot:GSA120T00005825001.1
MCVLQVQVQLHSLLFMHRFICFLILAPSSSSSTSYVLPSSASLFVGASTHGLLPITHINHTKPVVIWKRLKA